MTIEKALQYILYGGEVEKEAALETLSEYAITDIPFADIKLDELVTLLEVMPTPNINDWEGHIAPILKEKCETVHEHELRSVIYRGYDKNANVYRVVNNIFEERFDESSPNYRGDNDEDEENEARINY